MGSLKCPLCCRAEFPTRRALQQHLLDVLDLLKCPTCTKNFTSILGLVQHLSLSSCNVEVGVNFDEHFVTYVDCSFMKQTSNIKQEKTIAAASKIQYQTVPVQASSAASSVSKGSETMSSTTSEDIIIPDFIDTSNLILQCTTASDDDELICINLEQEIIEEAKVQQAKAATASGTSQSQQQQQEEVDRAEEESSKKIAVPNKRKGSHLEEPSDIKGKVTYVYECGLCCQRCTSKKDFRIHRCSGGGPYICEICGTKRISNQALTLHLNWHKREELEKKMNEPSTETFKCDVCSETMNANMAEVHAKVHSVGLRTYPCNLCPKVFLTEGKLDTHFDSDHGFAQCEICNKKLKTMAYLKKHMETHDEFRKNQCSYCEKSFIRKWDKLNHEKIHSGEKPLACTVCGKTFRIAYCLKVHMSTHKNERPFKCDKCQQSFKTQSVLANHMKTHKDDRPFTCSLCPKTFKSSAALAGHKNYHERPCKCTECGRNFGTKYDLQMHVLSLHNDDPDLVTFKCEFCEAVYKYKHLLKKHIVAEHVVDNVIETVAEDVKQEIITDNL